MSFRDARLKGLAAGLIAAASVGVYSKSLGNGFVWDDHIYVEGNRFIEEPRNLLLLLHPRFYLENQYVQAGSRPVFLASLIIDHWLWGRSPAGYHLTNALLHAANSAWVFLLALVFCRPRMTRGDPLSALGPAIVAGLLFALHPAASESVLAVSFRTGPLAAFFVFAGLSVLVAGRRMGGLGFVACLAGTGMLYALGLLAKETALALPVLVLLAELFFPSGTWTRKRVAAAASVFLAVTALYAGFRAPRFKYAALGAAGGVVEDASSGGDERLYRAPEARYVFEPTAPAWDEAHSGTASRVWMMSRVLLEYFRLTLRPSPLAADRAPPRGGFGPGVVAAWILLGLLALLVFALRRAHPPSAFGAAWFLAGIVPASGIVPLYNPVAERYLYLALAGAALAASHALWSFAGERRGLTASVLACLVLVVFARDTRIRTADWRSDKALLESSAETGLEGPRVHYNLARVRLKEGRPRAALLEYRKAVRRHPGYAAAWVNMGTTYKRLGLHSEARSCYERAVSLPWRSPLPAFVYGMFLEERGEPVRAAGMYRKALEIYPVFEPARLRLERLPPPPGGRLG